jgi:hypothetical protein
MIFYLLSTLQKETEGRFENRLNLPQFLTGLSKRPQGAVTPRIEAKNTNFADIKINLNGGPGRGETEIPPHPGAKFSCGWLRRLLR